VNRVVVTGIGIIAPSGIGTAEFWRNNTAGTGFLSHEPLMEQIGLRSRVVSRAAGFTLDRWHDPADLGWFSRLSRFAQFGVTVGAMAAADAGLARSSKSGSGRGPDAWLDPDRAGVVFSSAIGGTPEFQETYEVLSERGAHPVDAFPEDSVFYDSVFLNYAPAWVARTFGLAGPCTSLTTGCTAGIDALGLGCDLIRHGDLDLVVTGAAEAPLSGLAYATLDVIGSLAVGDWPPERASRPFDARRGGFVLGEGAAAVVLENADKAAARGARIYAEVLGYASQNNAHHMTDLAPDGAAMASVLRRVLDEAGASGQAVDYVNAHGSSTPQNDVFETQALKDVLGAHAYAIPVSSTKSMIGHSLAAASLTGTVATIGAFVTGMVPPTANYEFPDPECDLDYVPNVPREQHVGTALVMASGFGGIHSAALLRRPPASPFLTAAETVATGARDDMIGAGLVPRRPDGARPAAPGGEPVLFLHGFGGTAEHWAPLCRELDGIDPVAVDLPGHGANAMPLDLPGEQLIEALNRLAASLSGDSISGGWPGGITVVGHSLGALLALRLAILAPQRVRSLVLIATGLPLRVHPALAGQLGQADLDTGFLAGSLTSPDESALRLIADGFRQVRALETLTEVWGIGVGRTDIGDPRRVLVPSLVVVAGRDVVTAPRKGRALAAGLTGARVADLPDAGHYVHLERPAEVAGHIREHLRLLARAAAGSAA
jgi:3-oxoacyl-(acyl-carrier-protein) synthase/pimeloyl-ACP methyl ester carboxylesterase